MRVSVLAGHEIPTRPAMVVQPGDAVRVGDRDTEWPAFVFVSGGTGEGWIPERHLDERRPVATVRQRYDTQELAVSAGQVVEIVDDDPESGWAWCRDEQTREGWVPHRVLDLEGSSAGGSGAQGAAPSVE